MSTPSRLAAADGLTLACPGLGPWSLEWREPDWLGPIGMRAHCGGRRHATMLAERNAGDSELGEAVRSSFEGADDLGAYAGLSLSWPNLPAGLLLRARAYRERAILVFRIEAQSDLPPEIATREFRDVSFAWPFLAPRRRSDGGVPQGTRTYAHQIAEFALPVFGNDEAVGFMFAPHRPAAVLPLLFIAPDGRTLLIAPLDHFHEQIIAVPRDADDASHGVHCGWHGDLEQIGAGFATEMAVWAAPTPRAAFDQWCAFLRQRQAIARPSRYADDGVGKLSYWTDNGAIYYYRTEPGLDYSATLEKTVARLRIDDVPVRSVQIDSWFYPHENLRPVSPEGAPIVPPSGAMIWEPRADLFPDGMTGLRDRLGGLPLTFHSRHFSNKSPYFEQHACWRDEAYAHPQEASFYDMLMAQAASWGAITYEQDWLVESFLGVRGLRQEPGRARRWLEAMDTSARENGLTIQFCMATPADFLQTTSLTQVTSIRTSGDYRYLFDNGLNWVWFLHGNAFARALGLNPFKDVFLSHPTSSLGVAEPYVEIEALLASLSAGPVAIGDQIGATVRDLVMRSCRADGVLVKPDVPIAAIDDCFGANTFLRAEPLIGETYSDHPAGRWAYVAAFHACQSKEPLPVQVVLDRLGASRPAGPVLAYDWRRGSFERLEADGEWSCILDFQDWDYRVLCPLLPGEVTVFGDVSKYATVGDRHVGNITCADGCLTLTLFDRPGNTVEVHGYAPTPLRAVSAWVAGATRRIERVGSGESWTWDPSGRWVVRAAVGANGYTRLVMELGGD